MKELTTQEMERTSGGIWPIVGFALAVVGKTTASGPVGWAAGSAGLIYSAYQVGEYLGSQNSGVQVGPHSCYVNGS